MIFFNHFSSSFKDPHPAIKFREKNEIKELSLEDQTFDEIQAEKSHQQYYTTPEETTDLEENCNRNG